MNRRAYALLMIAVLLLMWLWLKPETDMDGHYKGMVEHNSTREEIQQMHMEPGPALGEEVIAHDPCEGVQDPNKPCVQAE